jgi:hypothetical protein
MKSGTSATPRTSLWRKLSEFWWLQQGRIARPTVQVEFSTGFPVLPSIKVCHSLLPDSFPPLLLSAPLGSSPGMPQYHEAATNPLNFSCAYRHGKPASTSTTYFRNLRPLLNAYREKKTRSRQEYVLYHLPRRMTHLLELWNDSSDSQTCLLLFQVSSRCHATQGSHTMQRTNDKATKPSVSPIFVQLA